jgi:hypothetical protein
VLRRCHHDGTRCIGCPCASGGVPVSRAVVCRGGALLSSQMHSSSKRIARSSLPFGEQGRAVVPRLSLATCKATVVQRTEHGRTRHRGPSHGVFALRGEQDRAVVPRGCRYCPHYSPAATRTTTRAMRTASPQCVAAAMRATTATTASRRALEAFGTRRDLSGCRGCAAASTRCLPPCSATRYGPWTSARRPGRPRPPRGRGCSVSEAPPATTESWRLGGRCN